MTYKAIIAGAVVVLAGAAGFGYLANTISNDNAHAEAEITAIHQQGTKALTTLRSQLQFYQTEANQEAGELHELSTATSTLKSASKADLGYCVTSYSYTYADGYISGTNNLDLQTLMVPGFYTPTLSGGIVQCPTGSFLSVVPQG